MTIRYTCTGCSSVLKIKEKKAGTQGKCPKCKIEFLIPNPDEAGDDEIAVEVGVQSVSDDSIDMPIELTPEVSESSHSDSADAFGTTPAFVRPGPIAATPSSGRKPSVAELMKDFEASKKKDKKSAPDVIRPVESSVSSAAQTSGSAADALSRNYQQKRDSASSAAFRPQDAKAAEERAMLTDFVKTRAIPAIAILSIVGYAYFWWMNREPYTGPALYPVTGLVMQDGKPAEGIRIEFYPVPDGLDDLRNGATAITNKEGEFRLIYASPFEGAPLGKYTVVLLGTDGNPVVPTEGDLTLTVTEDGENDFKINL